MHLTRIHVTDDQAAQIAALLNERNQLTKKYDREDVLQRASEYDFEDDGGRVVACVQRRRVQWYQWEICHLSVHEDWEDTGVAYKLYLRAAAFAERNGARILQCTIREGNEKSERFFNRQGFRKVATFANEGSGNNVGVWIKSIC